MCSWCARFHTAALVNRHIYDYGPRSHFHKHVFRNKFRCLGSRNKYSPNNQIMRFDEFANVVFAAEFRYYVMWHDVVDASQSR